MKIRPVRAELFHADSQTDRRAKRHDEANSHCHSSANLPKNEIMYRNKLKLETHFIMLSETVQHVGSQSCSSIYSTLVSLRHVSNETYMLRDEHSFDALSVPLHAVSFRSVSPQRSTIV